MGIKEGYCLQNSKIISSLPSSQSLYPITPLCIAGNILSKDALKVIASFFTLIKAQGLSGDLMSLALGSKSKKPLFPPHKYFY
ncbi:hypothetical protein CAHE111092_07585 [Campylobacter hepaticus]